MCGWPQRSSIDSEPHPAPLQLASELFTTTTSGLTFVVPASDPFATTTLGAGLTSVVPPEPEHPISTNVTIGKSARIESALFMGAPPG